MKVKDNRIFYLIIIIIQAVIIALYIVNSKNITNSYVIYRRISNLDGYQKSLGSNRHLYQYVMINSETKRIQYIGYLNGVPSVSPDGNKLVANCNTSNEMLCIVDISKFYDNIFEKKEEYIFEDDSFEIINSRVNFPTEAVLIKKIEVPEQCKELISEDYGLESISWNPDGNKLAIVCGINATNTWVNYQKSTNRRICFIDLKTEKSECWEDMDVRSALWSPTSDILLCSEGGVYDSQIAIIDINSKEREEVIEGRSADWSPDGEKIVFEDRQNNIRILNLKTNEVVTIYEKPSYSDYTGKFGFDSHPFSWSPDGKNITFQASYGGSLNLQVYMINIKTKEIQCLSCDDPEYNNNFNPTWGK